MTMINNFNLYPFNYWILYLAIAITIISLFLLLSKFFSFFKVVKSHEPEITKLNTDVQNLNSSVTSITEGINKYITMIKKITPYIIMSYFFFKNYNDSNDKGIKRINTSVRNTITRKPLRNENKFIKAMRSL